ncbi:hypothetical protein PCURB6_17900 [Paenibacillus curdlanolyticus]|nr:hypothetical protein PCURB6_17900 [Paenibacillus curdlanolyticus]
MGARYKYLDKSLVFQYKIKYNKNQNETRFRYMKPINFKEVLE